MGKKLSLMLTMSLLLSVLPASASTYTPSTISITVLFKNNSISAVVKDSVVNSGGKVISEIPEAGTMVVEGKSTLLSKLQSYSDVSAVSPTFKFKLPKTTQYTFTNEIANTALNDLYNAYQWDIKQVTNDGASFNINKGSHNTVVGIIDTGVSTSHPDLKKNLIGGRNFVPDGPEGVVVPGDIEDRNGHGTHVAGTISGNGRILGVAPDIGIKAYRIFGADGGATTDRVVNAIIAATDDGVDVISMSIGGYDIMGQWFYTDPKTGVTTKGHDVADFMAYKRAIKYAVSHGVTIAAAAGNSALNCANKATVTDYINTLLTETGIVGYRITGASFEVPGSIPGVITVSATGPDKSLASYSNYGAGFINITAPGGDAARYPNGDWYTDMCLSSCQYYDNNYGYIIGYAWGAGTSMATPKVSAVAALIIDQYKSKGMSIAPYQVANKLYKTSVDLGKTGTDPYFGTGMVNAYNALQ